MWFMFMILTAGLAVTFVAATWLRMIITAPREEGRIHDRFTRTTSETDR
ncbi:hypothetical protein GCM10017673_37960 [Streptosporangium violaceochromogenes]|nr:hypothetical protein GCM10017673_37960 [Streptosporangium violaceochromogenes]